VFLDFLIGNYRYKLQ